MAITLITTAGQQAIADALANNTTLKINRIAVGDGGGATYTPTVSQTTLKGQKWSGELNRKEIDPENEKQIIFEGLIAPGIGGFFIREVGLFDENNVLIAISDFPESYKAAADQYELYIRMIVEFANTDITNITVKQDMVYATKEYVDNAVNSSGIAEDLAAHKADNTKQIPHLGTTTNSGDVYSITTTEIINSNQKFTIKFNAVSITAPTLSINGGTSYSIKKANGNNAKLYASVYTLFWDGSNFIQLGEGGEYGNVVATDVRQGVTFGTESGLQTGTLKNLSVTAGDIVIAGSIAETSNATTTFVKLKEIKWTVDPGTLRMAFDLYTAASTNTAYGQIYINGIAVGTQRQTSSTTPVTYTQDLTVATNDLIQVYAKTSASAAAYVKNFVLKANNSPFATINL